VERGDLDQMSFAFHTRQDDFTDHGDGTYERVIEDVDLFDVSVVTYPAYEETNVEVVKRSFETRCKGAKKLPLPSPLPLPSRESELIQERLHQQRILEMKYGSLFAPKGS
jgi:hypothetical protein